jgi:hypothetical protein
LKGKRIRQPYHLEENIAMKNRIMIVVATISLLMSWPVQAQHTIDVAKITCRQFLIGKYGVSTRSVANWLSGYFNGKQGSTVLDVGAMEKNESALARYCRKHHDTPVMEAAKHALGLEK